MPRARTATPAKRAKLQDVAQLAGVSVQTVSRVVRAAPNVKPSTRQRVLAAVAELGYRPNLAARSLSAGKIGAVHLVVTTELFHGSAELFVAICEALAAMGLATSVSSAADHTDPAAIIPVSADAVIVLGGRHQPEEWLGSVASRVPMIYIGRHDGLPEGTSGVMMDMAGGARLAVEHLVERGATQLCHVAGPTDWFDAGERIRGFEDACRQLDVEHRVLNSATWDAVEAMRLGRRIPKAIDGVFASNDQIALGVLNYLHAHGRRIPGQVRVVGFDDSPGSGAFWPPLTTLRQEFRSLGSEAVSELSRRLEGKPARHRLITPKLIVRESS